MEIDGKLVDALKQTGVVVCDGSTNYITFPWIIRETYVNQHGYGARRIEIIQLKDLPPHIRERFKNIKP